MNTCDQEDNMESLAYDQLGVHATGDVPGFDVIRAERFGRYKVTIRLDSAGTFKRVEAVEVRRDFVSGEQRAGGDKYFDVTDLYEH